MRIIYNNVIPFKGFKAINLFGVLFVRGKAPLSDSDVNHESIHTSQMRELLYIPFYVIYLIEWVKRMLEGRDAIDAYRNISFEKEAYQNEDKPDYLITRKPFAQWIR